MPQDGRHIMLGCLDLQPVANLSVVLGMSASAATRFLKTIHVPTLYLGTSKFFLTSSLELALLNIMDFGGSGLCAPGSTPKLSNRHPAPVEIEPLSAKDRDRLVARLANLRTLNAKRIAQSTRTKLLLTEPDSFAGAVPAPPVSPPPAPPPASPSDPVISCAEAPYDVSSPTVPADGVSGGV